MFVKENPDRKKKKKNMYDTYTYHMHDYDIKYNEEIFYVIIKYRIFP